MMRTIVIDFDVHQKIELERTSFEETPNEVLRRLLKLGSATQPSITSPSMPPARRPWSSNEVTLPHGTQLRMEYNNRVHEGQIVDGRWIVEGKEAKSPSGAAVMVARTKAGKATSLNGWGYWKVKRAEDTEFISLVSLCVAELDVF